MVGGRSCKRSYNNIIELFSFMRDAPKRLLGRKQALSSDYQLSKSEFATMYLTIHAGKEDTDSCLPASFSKDNCCQFVQAVHVL